MNDKVTCHLIFHPFLHSSQRRHSMSSPAAAFLPLPFLERNVELTERPDGALLMRSRIPLGAVEKQSATGSCSGARVVVNGWP